MGKEIYVEPDTFLCHAEQNEAGTLIPAIPTAISFDGKCDTFIEGYRCVPFGYIWIHPDGRKIEGEMVSPWKPYSELDSAQREYEKQKLENCLEALQELGVEV